MDGFRLLLVPTAISSSLQLTQGCRVPVMLDCLLVSSASFRGAHGSDYWRLARIGTSDPESSETLLAFWGLGFGTEIPCRFLDSRGHGRVWIVFPAKCRRPATLSVHISVDLAIETCQPPLLDSLFFAPSLFFRVFFCMPGGADVDVRIASDSRRSVDRA